MGFLDEEGLSHVLSKMSGPGMSFKNGQLAIDHPNIPITKEAYDELSEEEKNNGAVYITDEESLSKDEIKTLIGAESAYKKAVTAGYTGTEETFYKNLITGPWRKLKSTECEFSDSPFPLDAIFPFPNPSIWRNNGEYQFYGINGLSRIKIATPTDPDHGATKWYVDKLIGEISTLLDSINGEVI